MLFTWATRSNLILLEKPSRYTTSLQFLAEKKTGLTSHFLMLIVYVNEMLPSNEPVVHLNAVYLLKG